MEESLGRRKLLARAELVLKPRLGGLNYTVVLCGMFAFGLGVIAVAILGIIQGAAVGNILLGVVIGLGCLLFPFLAYRNIGVIVDSQFVYQTLNGKSLPPVARGDIDRIVWRGGRASLISTQNKLLMVGSGLLSKRQMEALARHLDCPFQIYEKPAGK